MRSFRIGKAFQRKVGDQDALRDGRKMGKEIPRTWLKDVLENAVDFEGGDAEMERRSILG